MDKYMKLKDIPKGQRWAHFKEYYKIHTFAVIFFGFILITLVKDVFFQEKYDVVVTQAATRYYSEEVTDEMTRMFTEHARDYDGNGKRNVSVFHIPFDTSTNADVQMVMASQTKLIGQFQDDNDSIFLINDEICKFLQGDESDEMTFANLKETVGGSVTPLLREESEYRLYLKDIPAFQESEILQRISDDLFFVMRREEHVNPKGEEELAELYSRSVQLMESLAAGTAEPEMEEK